MSAKRAKELTERIDATLATLIFLVGALENELEEIDPLELTEEEVIPVVLTDNGEDG
jgi:hypothetical protein